MPLTMPSTAPSASPSGLPSSYPSINQSEEPSSDPSTFISAKPSLALSSMPSYSTTIPSIELSHHPSSKPSSKPITVPSVPPSSQPSVAPSLMVSFAPTASQSSQPSYKPSPLPSRTSSSGPSFEPSAVLSVAPTLQTSNTPSNRYSLKPSHMPSLMPTLVMSSNPTSVPISTAAPSSLPRATTPAPSSIPSIPNVSVLIGVIYELTGSCECTDIITSGLVATVTEQLETETQDIIYIIESVECTPLCSNSTESNRSLSDGQDKLRIFFAFFQSVAYSDADKILPLENMVFLLRSFIDSTISSISTRSGQAFSKILLTLAESPSAAPSSSPSMLRSAFDGDSCRFNVECQIGICDKSTCRSEVSIF